jgi:AcrR family transcriptional regulator
VTRDHRSIDVAQRILDAAEELFYVRGVDGTGVDAISERSGVSKSTLYRHFRTKEDLVAAYLVRGHGRRLREWVAVIGGEAEAPERILGVFDWLATWFRSKEFGGCRFINAAVQLRDDRHPGYAIPQQHKEEIRLLLAEAAAEAGASAPGELAHELMLLIDGAVVHALLERDDAPAMRAKRLAALALAAHGVALPAARLAPLQSGAAA